MKDHTIYDVAKQAGVSPATVSRVLNTPSLVNEDKRKRVLEAIDSMGFVPKAEAVAKARRQYRKIGVIAPFFTEPSFMERLKGIASVLSGQHYELVIYAIESCEELESYIDMLVSNRRVDGLILLCMTLSKRTSDRLRRSAIPVCFVETETSDFDSVVIANRQGGELAARFLYQNGYRMPGFIGEASVRPYAAHSTEERLAGFSSYFADRGVPLEKKRIWLGSFEREVSTQAILHMLDCPDHPDCIFASSDMLAIRILKCAVQLGMSVPDDLGVVGFDNIEMAEFVNLTTLDQSLEESGIQAAEFVLQRIKEPDRRIRRSLIDLKLLQRSSTEIIR